MDVENGLDVTHSRFFRTAVRSPARLHLLRDPRNVVRGARVNARKSRSTTAYARRYHSYDHCATARTTSDHQGPAAVGLE